MTEEQRVDQLIDCLRHRPVATTAAQMREAADLIESFRKRFDKQTSDLVCDVCGARWHGEPGNDKSPSGTSS
jgi:hypothetical protein